MLGIGAGGRMLAGTESLAKTFGVDISDQRDPPMFLKNNIKDKGGALGCIWLLGLRVGRKPRIG